MRKKYKIGYTSGVFDIFHVGHLNILKKSKELCDYLIVGVTTDELCYRRKNKYPVYPLNERIEILEAIKYIDLVIVQDNMEKLNVIKKYNCDVVLVGSDWKGTESWNKYEQEFKEFNCDVVYIDYTKGVSSSLLRKKIIDEGVK